MYNVRLKGALLKRQLSVFSIILLAIAMSHIKPANAVLLDVGGKPLVFTGYINQGIQYGIAGDHYDTMQGFQAAVFQCLLEGEYAPTNDTKIFVSGMLNMDLAYPVFDYTDNKNWKDRQFDKSDDEKFILDDSETLLKEAHSTFNKGDFVIRIGKQIVKWGETDFLRIVDQINPSDSRRGISDVEFETSIIPIWLGKVEFFPQIESNWMQDLGLELVVNPNMQFISDKSILAGNDEHGIWAVNIPGPSFYDISNYGLGMDYMPSDYVDLLPVLYPTIPDIDMLVQMIKSTQSVQSRIGSMNFLIDEPDEWDDNSYEYGFRIKSIVKDTFITLNYFYGLENSPVVLQTGNFDLEMGSDGSLILHPEVMGNFPIFKFAGITLSRDFPRLIIKKLGGVSPVLRLESFYAFNRTYATSGKTGGDEFEKFDEIRYSVGIDWKVMLKPLNPRDGFMISSQFIHHHIMDYPENYGLSGAGGSSFVDDNYSITMGISTSYMHNKIKPALMWQRSIQESTQGDIFIAMLSYEKSHKWNYTLQGVWAENDGLRVLDHKDNISITAAYRF